MFPGKLSPKWESLVQFVTEFSIISVFIYRYIYCVIYSYAFPSQCAMLINVVCLYLICIGGGGLNRHAIGTTIGIVANGRGLNGFRLNPMRSEAVRAGLGREPKCLSMSVYKRS